MGIYQDQVLPRVIDAVMNRREFTAIRDRVCSGLEGEVLEIGFGSGLNILHYPPAVSKGAGLLDCSRRLGLSLNTVKRYDRADVPERLQRAPQYRPTLVDPYRDHLRKRRAEKPGSRSGSCCGRSGSSATRAAPTCSSATLTRAAPTVTGRTWHPARHPSSCSPSRRT